MFPYNNIHIPQVHRAFGACLVTLFIVAGVFVALPKNAEAQAIPFGGMITWVEWCFCSENLKVVVGPPVGGIYMYQPGASVLYEFFQIWQPGVWVLGLATAYMPCLQYPYCEDDGGGPMINIVGTSM